MKTFQLTVEDIIKNKVKLKDLFKQSYEVSFPNKSITNSILNERISSLIEYVKEEKAIVLGAKNSNEELLGFVWFFIKQDLDVLHINSFVVDEKYRKQGIGKALWLAIEEFADINRIKELELLVTKNNTTAVKFYEDRDFEVERFIMKKRLIN